MLHESGIAIGPILFVIALLGILAAVIAAGTGDFGTATIADRIYNDILSQANLIRTKINECNLKYGTNNNGDGWPPSDATNGTPVCAIICEGDSNSPMAGNDCTGNGMTTQNLWYGMRAALCRHRPSGFQRYLDMNAGASGGRCIWTQPSIGRRGHSGGPQSRGCKFSGQEVLYNAGGTTHTVS